MSLSSKTTVPAAAAPVRASVAAKAPSWLAENKAMDDFQKPAVPVSELMCVRETGVNISHLLVALSLS